MCHVTYFRAATVAALVLIAAGTTARAQVDLAFLREIETENIFGFTEGSGIGLEGEKEVFLDTEARIGKRDGRYFASESKLGFEFTPSQYIQFEFGPFVSAHSIHGVTGLDDRGQLAFGGIFGEISYLLLGRGPSSPLSVTISAEPTWRRVDETSGESVTNAELELKLKTDVELIENRLYLGANLLYEPEATHDPEHVGAGWAMESKGGISAALSYRILPTMLIGGEVWYLRHYDGALFNDFTGDAIYVGPTIYIQIAPKVFVAAAWSAQVSGSEVDNPDASLNLAEFSRQRAKLKMGVEF